MSTINARQNVARSEARSGRNLTILSMDHCIPVPKAPAGTSFDADERKTWRELWKGPVAQIWDESYIPAVATYVLLTHKLYQGQGTAWVASEQRALGDSLGLSPKGLKALGFSIEGMPS